MLFLLLIAGRWTVTEWHLTLKFLQDPAKGCLVIHQNELASAVLKFLQKVDFLKEVPLHLLLCFQKLTDFDGIRTGGVVGGTVLLLFAEEAELGVGHLLQKFGWLAETAIQL